MRKIIFANQHIYHLYNRGVAEQEIFSDDTDYQHLLITFSYYLEALPKTRLSSADRETLQQIINTAPKRPLVEIIGYCLMPNHFHLVVKQIKDNGVSTFIRRSLDSYTRYYNIKHKRIGTIFQGKFKAVRVESDEQLIHLSRYIHLNPFVAQLVNKPENYKWSSYKWYLQDMTNRLCHPLAVIELVDSSKNYQAFVEDYAEYAQSLARLKNLLLE